MVKQWEETKLVEEYTEVQYSQEVSDWLDMWTDDMRKVAYRHTQPTAVVPHLMALMGRKEPAYGMSWAKGGVIGFWKGAIVRQIDRVDPGFRRLVMCKDLDAPGTHRVVTSLLGTLGDVANYALMGICLLASMFPETYDAWLEKMADED